MTYTIIWTGPDRVTMQTDRLSAEDAVRHARTVGAPGTDIRILVDGQTLTFDELLRVVLVSRRA